MSYENVKDLDVLNNAMQSDFDGEKVDVWCWLSNKLENAKSWEEFKSQISDYKAMNQDFIAYEDECAEASKKLHSIIISWAIGGCGICGALLLWNNRDKIINFVNNRKMKKEIEAYNLERFKEKNDYPKIWKIAKEFGLLYDDLGWKRNKRIVRFYNKNHIIDVKCNLQGNDNC